MQGVVAMPKKKLGPECPTCYQTLMGRLIPHCHPGMKSTNPKDVLDDALGEGTPRGCAWMRCPECKHFGIPGENWVRIPLEAAS